MSGFDEFVGAVKKGNMGEVEMRYKDEFTNMTNSVGATPLHEACKEGHVHIVHYLITKGADTEAMDFGNQRPLHLAAFKGNSDIVTTLVERGVRLEERTKNGWTPLHLACRGVNLDLVNYLLSKGANIEAETDHKETPLHVASRLGHHSIALSLIDKGSLLEERVDRGETALHMACARGNVDIVRHLISKGCDIEAENKNKERPIHEAAKAGYTPIVQILIERGCLLEEHSLYGSTPLHLACRGGNVDVVGILINNGSNIEAEDDNDKQRPLHMAAKGGHKHVLNILIAHGCLLEERTEYNETAFHIATREKKEECAQILRDAVKMQSYLSQFRSKHEDSELLAVLKSAEEGIYREMEEAGVLSLVYSLTTIFAEKYKEELFAKMKNDVLLNRIDRSKVNCLSASVTILGRAKEDSAKEYLSQLLTKLLVDLYEVSSPNNEFTNLLETFLFSLTNICRCGFINFDKETLKILLKYFNKTDIKEVVKKASAYVMLNMISRGFEIEEKDIREVLIYLKNVSEETDDSMLDGVCKFSFDSSRRSEIQKAVREMLKPSLIDIERVSLLGRGSYGATYKCLDIKAKLFFAVKEFSELSQYRMRDNIIGIEKEIKRYITLPYQKRITRLYKVIIDDCGMRIFMEYVRGGSLRSKIDRDGPLQSAIIALYSQQVLEGLDFLHKRKIVHGDIRARNILIEDDDNVKLCEYGIGKYFVEIISEKSSTTNDINNIQAANDVFPSLYWTAPEKIKGDANNESSDLWSLGATVVEMYTGYPPYHELDLKAARDRILTYSSNCHQLPQDAPTKLKCFISLALVPDPVKRADLQMLRQSSFINDMSVPSLDNYTRGQSLGQGAYGAVYLCTDVGSEMHFALKEVSIVQCGTMEKEIETLENEIKIYNQLKSHDRILRYFGTTRSERAVSILMEYMPGGSLKSVLERNGPFPPPLIAKYVKQVLQGLEFLHKKNIIHRDIKCANTLRDEDDNIKLCDFGISKCLATQTFNRSHGTIAGTSHCKRRMVDSSVGTVYFMAPEVLKGEEYSVWADVWSLGATVVEMLTGNPPYHDREPLNVVFLVGINRRVEYQSPQPIPTPLQTLLDMMLVGDPHERATVQKLLKCDFLLN